MKKLSYLAVFVIVIALIVVLGQNGSKIQAKATTYTENDISHVNFSFWVPCAADGAGEYVELSGYIHWVYHYMIDANGGRHGKYHHQYQNLSGVGLTTGDKYQGTGVTQRNFNWKVGETYTYVDNFRIIGQGTGNNFLGHATYHYTINANGEMTAYVDNYSVECK